MSHDAKVLADRLSPVATCVFAGTELRDAIHDFNNSPFPDSPSAVEYFVGRVSAVANLLAPLPEPHPGWSVRAEKRDMDARLELVAMDEDRALADGWGDIA